MEAKQIFKQNVCINLVICEVKKVNITEQNKWQQYQWTTAPLKYQLHNAFMRMIHSDSTTMADVQSLNDRHCLKPAFSIELRLITRRQQHVPAD